MTLFLTKGPQPKDSRYPDRPEAYQWADRVNAAAPHSRERTALIFEALEHGITFTFIRHRRGYGPDYAPAGAEGEYTFIDPGL